MPIHPALLFFLSLLLSVSANAGETATLASAANPILKIEVQDAAEQDPIGNFAEALAHDLTQPTTDVWQRIRIGYALPDLDNDLVREQEEWYANRPEYVARMVERSRRYLYYIIEEVEKRGMPTEIALLPMIESAYNPVAYSRSRASGIWQFIPSTGKDFGLQQNWWYDGRRDVMAATDAALDYLEKLYNMFGSWDLALAAYNWGEGAVGRAIARNQALGLPTDYSSLQMPNETRYYVPKLQAVKNLVADPQRFGLVLAPIDNQPYFTAVTATQQMDVRLAAKLAEVPLEEFISLNPAFMRPVITKNGSRTLLLPVDKANTFVENLENHDAPLLSWRVYNAKRGERFDKIAARHGMSSARLREVNGIPATRRTATAGQPLLVPARSGNLPNLRHVEYNQPQRRGSDKQSYLVKRGDTLLGIARRHGVSAAQLKTWNKLRSNRIASGQRLAIKATVLAQYSAGKRRR